MNLPALQRIAMEFEKENDIMDQRQEMMDDAIDDVTGLEDEEEGEEVVKEVLDEIGVDLGQAVCASPECEGIVLVGIAESWALEKVQLANLFLGTDGRNTLRPPEDSGRRRSGRRSYRWWRRRTRRGRRRRRWNRR